MTTGLPRAVLLGNPRAGQFSATAFRRARAILERSYRVNVDLGGAGRDMSQAAAHAAASGAKLVVAAGGDGLIHHIAAGLIGSETCLGIIPMGTANMLARSLGLPRRAEAAAGVLAHQPAIRSIWPARVDLDGGRYVCWSVSQFGVGLDAMLVQIIERHPRLKRASPLTLYAAGLAALVCSEPRRLRRGLEISCGERQTQAETVLVQVRWPYCYFGPLVLRLTPAPTRGLDALVIDRLSLASAVRGLIAMVRGRGLNARAAAEIWPECPRLTFRARDLMPCEADGEYLGEASRIELSVEQRALSIAVPHQKVADKQS